MDLRIETEREDDGRWIAEMPAIPGVMVYGKDRVSAITKVQALAMQVLAERLADGEAEVMEDVALLRAIQEGEASGLISRDEVFQTLDNAVGA